MSLKTETHILCSGCKWVGLKEELYLSSPQLGQVRHWSCRVAASCAQLLVAPDMLHFQIPNQMGPAIHLIQTHLSGHQYLLQRR